jgi:adenylate kinase
MESVIFLFGPPGSGKGTQAARLANKLQAETISTGVLLRKSWDDWKHSADGTLAPAENIIRLLDEAISAAPGDQAIVFDGVGRKQEEVEWLSGKLQELGRPIRAALRLHVPDDELERRLLGRAVVENRTDDDHDGILNRLNIYKEKTSPIQTYWEDKTTMHDIDGVGTPDEVEARIWEAVNRAA